ncbi:T9SS type A sorting domain-containing protein [Flavobacterium sp. ASV13]|uniref:T9SS type A sorting domain-containing protein n=1 Tax=Flavobacterium sp. ASV13 TaxID=1506583 RepID=UPI00054F99B5|nr:T9SS type A sorting domain-containing protein [Flavobacterium sp. ASV13]
MSQALQKILLFISLITFSLHSQVTIKTGDLKIDNILVANNTISFNNNPSINISLDIHMQTSDGSIDNTFGNLFLYYKKNESDSPTQVGFQSIAFYTNVYYKNDTQFNITLFKNFFFNIGGTLYAEYKNNNNKIFQSNKIPITSGSLIDPPIAPPTTNGSIATQNIKYSVNLPLTNSKILISSNASTYFDLDVFAKRSDTPTEISIYLKREDIGTITSEDAEYKKVYLKHTLINKPNDNYISIKDIPIYIEKLDFTKYTYTLKVQANQYNSNYTLLSAQTDFIYQDNNKINILLVKPIEYNTIADSQTLTSGQTSAPFTTQSPWVDYTIYCERRGCISQYDYRYVTNFKWQNRTQNTEWADIPQANTKDYSPNKTFIENTYYRRIAFYDDGQYNISNTISIILNDQNNENTICCNQNLPLRTSQPQVITGSISNSNNLTYQWQICTNPSYTPPIWTDIANASASYYSHIFTIEASRGTGNTAFRRLLKQNSLTVSISNQVNITRPESSTVKSMLTPGNLELSENDINNTTIYPNPFINNFYIEGPKNINQIKLFDSFGQTIDIQKNQKSENLIEVSTSNLLPGVYLLKIDNQNFSKTLLKN